MKRGSAAAAVIVSHFYDSNINHFFTLEINAIHRAIQSCAATHSVVRVVLVANAADRRVQQWRASFVRAMLASPELLYVDDGAMMSPEEFDRDFGPANNDVVALEKFTWSPPRDGTENGPFVEAFDFGYVPSDETRRRLSELRATVVGRILSSRDLSPPRDTILIVVRSNTRVAYDVRARDKRLEEYVRESLRGKSESLLSRIRILSDADGCPFERQVELFATARCIVGVHGAALTNVVFADPRATLIEISFRKHWYCDPLCARHQSGECAYAERCGSTLGRPYHKADYRNLAVARGLSYVEVDTLDGDTFESDNHISVRKLYVDGEDVVSKIKRAVSTPRIL